MAVVVDKVPLDKIIKMEAVKDMARARITVIRDGSPVQPYRQPIQVNENKEANE